MRYLHRQGLDRHQLHAGSAKGFLDGNSVRPLSSRCGVGANHEDPTEGQAKPEKHSLRKTSSAVANRLRRATGRKTHRRL
jgi:hypothetical protein